MSTVTKLVLEAERESAEEALRLALRGAPTGNNSLGRPDVRMVGRSPRPTTPIRSVKSAIVPEPDQVRSEPPHRSTPLEPPGS